MRTRLVFKAPFGVSARPRRDLRFRISFLSFLCCLVLAVVAACNHEIKKPPHEPDRNSGPTGSGGGGYVNPTDASSPSTEDGGACTDLEITGSVIDENGVNGEFTAVGGVILDGTYDIVEARLYLGASGLGGPTSTTYQGSVRINGTSYESAVIAAAPGAPSVETRSKGTLNPDGADAGAALELTCPVGSNEDLTYTATGDSLTLYNPSTKVALVLRQRP
jgi:hypothetical protein